MTSTDWDERYGAAELVWSAEPNRLFAKEVEGLRPGRALDLACGEGRNAIWLAARGWTVTAVDFSEVAIDKARRLADTRGVQVEWVTADLLAYQPPSESFDLVALIYLQLPHAQLSAVLRRATGALAPGGTLLIIGHDTRNLAEGHGGPRDPTVLFTPKDVESDIEGLIVERSERVLRPVTVDGKEVNAIDALVRARRPA